METHVLRRVAEEVVLVDVVRLEDGVEGGEDGEAGVDLSLVLDCLKNIHIQIKASLLMTDL